eukprot:SAG31_NODE_7583_length_1647_cov_4.801034_2_plen_73_part_01
MRKGRSSGFFTGFIVPFGVVVYQLTHRFGQSTSERWDGDEQQMKDALHNLYTNSAALDGSPADASAPEEVSKC